MKVLNLIAFGYGSKGAWSSQLERHYALRKMGIDSSVLCIRGANEASYITELKVNPNRIERKIYHLLKRGGDWVGLSHIPAATHFAVAKAVKKLDFDILYICSPRNLTSYFLFPSLTRHKPTIFNIGSMSSFTGSCFHSLNCDRWKIGCGKCPYIGILTNTKRDASYIEWRLKDWSYSHSNLTITSNSNWLTEQLKQSMLNRFPIHQIPLGVNTEIYQPLDSEQCRKALGIPSGKKVLMFATDRLGDHLKGGDLLIKALKGLPDSLKNETILLLMGDGGEKIAEALGIQTLQLGYVYDGHRKAMCYSAADLFIFPTRAETFGLVSIESQACGTPLVSFEVGGIPDHVRHGITGYLAKPEDVEDFRNGIIQLLENEPLRKEMGQKCRAVILEEYDIRLWAKRFIDICQKLLHSGKSV
jgi:glycosyltransferase involved in cell wall biosynthesis